MTAYAITDETCGYVLSHALLNRDEETRLLALAKKGNQDAIEKITNLNQRLVHSIARHFHNIGVGGDQTIEDLVQWGEIGLSVATRRFDPDKGARFSTFATWWISSYIRRYGNHSGSSLGVSYRFAYVASTVRRTRNHMVAALSREPSTEELSEETGHPRQVIEQALALTDPIISIDGSNHSAGEERPGLEAQIKDKPPSIEEQITSQDMRAILIQAVDKLPPYWKSVITLRFGLNDTYEQLSYTEIASRFKVSRSRIQEIERQALKTLRKSFIGTGLTLADLVC